MSQRIFLIDGSSQMYRAYHAMRGSGLTGPGGRSTHAVYIFVTMLRKLIQDHQPQYIAASFDLAGPTFRSDMATDYKANRSPMPPDLAEQIPWVHEACEAMGVPILTYQRFEADDVIGTLATRAAEQGFEVAIVTGDKDFFQLVHDGIKVYNPRDDGTWYDAEGVKEKFGVAPEQVVDVLALMGDSIDNIKGVPGIGEKGRSRSDRRLRLARERCCRTPRRSRTSGIAKGCSRTPRMRGKAASWRESAPTCRSSSSRDASLSRRVARTLLRAVHAARVSARWSWITRRTRSRSARTTRWCERSKTCARWPRTLRGVERFGFRVLPDAPSAMRPGSSVSRSRPDRGRRGTSRSRPPQSSDRSVRRAGREARDGVSVADALAALKDVLENPAIAKVGHDLKFDAIVLERHGVALRGHRDRHDARELPARCDAIVASARGARARAQRLQGAARGRSLRPRREGDPVRPDSAGRRARLRRRARGSRAAAVRNAAESAPAGRAREALSRPRAAARSGARRDRAAGIRIDGPALANSRRTSNGSSRPAARRSSRWPAKSSTSTRRSSSPRSCSTSCSCRR